MASPLVIIVGADKGGVGKTFVSRALLSYFADRGVKARAFDTEVPAGNLKRFHPDAQVVDLSSSDGQMAVYDTLNVAPVTVIDIRAGLLSQAVKDLSETGFLQMAREGKVRIAVLHVIGSTLASFNEIAATAAALANAKHFIVTNHMNDASFFAGIANVSKDALETSLRIDVPKLDERATEFVEAASLPFGAFVKDDNQSLWMRGKVGHWLSLVSAELDRAKLIEV